jgi:hypothetical protein
MTNITENLNVSSWIEPLSSTNQNDFKNLNDSFTAEEPVLKKIKKDAPTTSVIDSIEDIASRSLFATNQQYNKPPAWLRINHIVVLMLENRSFDNLLGGLYPKSAQFNGLAGNEENSYVDRAGIKHTLRVWNSQGARKNTPNPDPGEEFLEINYQIFKTHEPTLSSIPTMSGFAQNYYDFICEDKVAQKELRKKRGLPEDHAIMLRLPIKLGPIGFLCIQAQLMAMKTIHHLIFLT